MSESIAGEGLALPHDSDNPADAVELLSRVEWELLSPADVVAWAEQRLLQGDRRGWVLEFASMSARDEDDLVPLLIETCRRECGFVPTRTKAELVAAGAMAQDMLSGVAPVAEAAHWVAGTGATLGDEDRAPYMAFLSCTSQYDDAELETMFKNELVTLSTAGGHSCSWPARWQRLTRGGTASLVGAQSIPRRQKVCPMQPCSLGRRTLGRARTLIPQVKPTASWIGFTS